MQGYTDLLQCFREGGQFASSGFSADESMISEPWAHMYDEEIGLKRIAPNPDLLEYPCLTRRQKAPEQPFVPVYF